MTHALTAALGIPAIVGMVILSCWGFTESIGWAMFAGVLTLASCLLGWAAYWAGWTYVKALFSKKTAHDGHGKPKKPAPPPPPPRTKPRPVYRLEDYGGGGIFVPQATSGGRGRRRR